jgi:hypothetical protein
MNTIFIILGIFVTITFRRVFLKLKDAIHDGEACESGLDACQGSIEYYDKAIKRNQILRQIIEDGSTIIDSEGEIFNF